MKVSDYIALECKKLNDHTFLFVGGGNMHLTDSLGRVGTNLIHMHHEQALAMAAEGYARITGKPSVCVVTSGPGGINALNGVFGAWVDSIPMIVISGQVRTEIMRRGSIRQIGDQEADIVSMVRPITKFAEVCKDPDDISRMFSKAVYEASTGRQGPVWLDIPLDVQAEYYSCEDEYDPEDQKPPTIPNVMKLIRKAKRPVILAGSGIRSARAIYSFWKFVDKVRIPVIPNFNARDLGQFKHPIFGMQGSPRSNSIIKNADLILILGCRMNIRQIGWEFGKFGKDAITIMVDIDEDELNKHTFKPDIKVHADILDFLRAMPLEEYTNDWALSCEEKIPRFDTINVHPKEFIKTLNEYTEDGDVITFGNGTYPTVGIQYLNVKSGMRLLLNSGCGSMGYGLPVSIGAAFASGRRVICLTGDGSIQLNIQELQTIVHHNLPIKIFIGNNNGYASIRNTQDNYFGGFYVGAGPDSGLGFPNMRRIAGAYGIPYARIYSNGELEPMIRSVLSTKGPAICELLLDKTFKLETTTI